MSWISRWVLFAGFLSACSLRTPADAAEVLLTQDGQARAAIFVSARVWDDPAVTPESAVNRTSLKPEDLRCRLRESVRDFAAILQRISGATVEVVVGAPAARETRLPILIGELAQERFGQPGVAGSYAQGYRIVVQPDAVGLWGESDLSASYAIYTLLEQLGCRWYIPSEMGEVLPKTATIAVAEQDLSDAPDTVFRGLWFCDNDFGRRNRLGGMLLNAGHALEYTVPKELREQHPEVRAIIRGEPHAHLVKWTHPLIAQAVSDAILTQIAADPSVYSYSLSPDDGATWDESDDAAYDAGDFDPAAQCISKTDRLMVFANRVAERIHAQYPDIKLGILAYADYVRPPVREKVHPALVPQVAPITYSRAHPMNDDREPNNRAFRELVDGWGRTVPATSYYFYAFNLAEVATPNPFIRKWGHDIPYIYEHGACQYWQPETLCNFETCMHGLYLGLRLAWDHEQQPDQIFAELHEKFYGPAAKPMAGYWDLIDRTWVETDEFSGCGFGHLRRWTPERLSELRALITEAESAAGYDAAIAARVQLAAESFGALEQFMALRRDLAEGNFAGLDARAETYRQNLIALGERYQPQFSFARMFWTGENTLNVRYFDAFYNATYLDAARLAAESKLLTPTLRSWRYQQDEEKTGEAAGWMQSDFDDSSWQTTDPVVQTWSTLGLHNYMGSLWYRTTVDLADLQDGKKSWLWIGATDGRVKVFVNGQHVPYVDAQGQPADSFTGYCQPARFEITSVVRPGANQISLYCTRETLNELGTGGLLAPPVVFREP